MDSGAERHSQKRAVVFYNAGLLRSARNGVQQAYGLQTSDGATGCSETEHQCREWRSCFCETLTDGWIRDEDVSILRGKGRSAVHVVSWRKKRSHRALPGAGWGLCSSAADPAFWAWRHSDHALDRRLAGGRSRPRFSVGHARMYGCTPPTMRDATNACSLSRSIMGRIAGIGVCVCQVRAKAGGPCRAARNSGPRRRLRDALPPWGSWRPELARHGGI